MWNETEWREYDCQKSSNVWQFPVPPPFYPILRVRNKAFFDALQEYKTENDYGTLLGRLVCFYVRLSDLEKADEEDPRVVWFRQHPLNPSQAQKLDEIRDLLNTRDYTNLDTLLHETLKELFCWRESRTLLDEIHCPVQRFLMVVCLRREGNGFIPVHDITPLIAKLMYSIRATVYMELMKREGTELQLENDLDGLQVYVKEQIQSPFGFLSETMHLASYIAGNASALPQITWIGKDHMSLAIHGKRVDLEQLRSLSKKVLQVAIRLMEYDVKKGMPGVKPLNWKMFDPEDDLGSTDLNYSFVNKPFHAKRMALVNQFLGNRVTDEYFTRGRVEGNVLWNKENVLAWLKKCKKLLQYLAISCHLEGGQPSRGREFVTIRWKNGSDEQRGVFWADGTVFLLGRYSKVRSQVSHDRLIPRYSSIS